MKYSNVDLNVMDELFVVYLCHKQFDLSLHRIENVKSTLSKGGCKLGGYSSFFVGEFKITDKKLEEGLSFQGKEDGEPTTKE